MSHRPLFAFAALLVVSATAVSSPVTDAFTGLVGGMQTRQGALLASTQTKSLKRQEKFLGTSITRLSTPAPTPLGDLKNAAGVIKGLEKSFPTDFSKKASPTFGELVTAALVVVDVQVEKEYKSLVSDLTSVTDKALHAEAEGDRAKARAALDLVAVAPTETVAGALLYKAFRFVVKGRAAAASQPVTSVMTATVDDGPFAAKTFSVDVVVSAGILDVTGYVNAPTVPSFRRIQFISNGAPIHGTGPYSLQCVYDNGTTPMTYSHHMSFGGVLNVTTYDLANHRVAGDFSFTTNEPLPANQFHVTNGHFDIQHVRVQ